MLDARSFIARSWNWSISRLRHGVWSAVVLLLLSYVPRPGVAFVHCRGAVKVLGRGSYGVGGTRRLLASKG